MFVYTARGLTNLNYIEIFVTYLADSVKNDNSVNAVLETALFVAGVPEISTLGRPKSGSTT